MSTDEKKHQRFSWVETINQRAFPLTPSMFDEPAWCISDTAMLMVDEVGYLQYASAPAKRIIELSDITEQTLTQLLQHLAVNLTLKKFHTHPNEPVVYYHQSTSAKCEFRAYWMEGANSASRLIGVSIHSYELTILKMIQLVSRFKLPKRESQVCVMLMMGETQAAIASRLQVSLNTVIHYRRSLYTKFNVKSRAELQAKIIE